MAQAQCLQVFGRFRFGKLVQIAGSDRLIDRFFLDPLSFSTCELLVEVFKLRGNDVLFVICSDDVVLALVGNKLLLRLFYFGSQIRELAG